MERCLISYIISEPKIKTMKYHCRPSRTTKTQNTDNIKCRQDVEQQKCSHIAGGNTKWYSHLARQFGRLIQGILLLCNPAIVLVEFLPVSWKHVCIKSCTRMFIAAPFTIAKTWKQLRYPSVGEWINCGISRNIISWLKETSYQVLKRNRGNLNAYYWVK
jgi:hypothetical protein